MAGRPGLPGDDSIPNQWYAQSPINRLSPLSAVGETQDSPFGRSIPGTPGSEGERSQRVQQYRERAGGSFFAREICALWRVDCTCVWGAFPPDSFKAAFVSQTSPTVAATRLTRGVYSTGVETTFGMLGLVCRCGGTSQYLCTTTNTCLDMSIHSACL